MSLEALAAENVVEAKNGVYGGFSIKCYNRQTFVEAKILQPRNGVKHKKLVELKNATIAEAKI